jgi:teichuronic acid exporter
MDPIKKTSRNPNQQLSISKKAASGFVWLFMQSMSGRVSILVSQLVLAKILFPEDFGVLGLASTITSIFGVFTDVSIDQILQQRRSGMRLWATQAFWMSLSLGMVMALAMSICAPFGAKLYHNDNVAVLVWVTASSLPISALRVVPQAQLASSMKFKFLASYGTGEFFASQIMTILFALLHFGALSFVLPGPLLATIRAIVFWKVAPLHLRPFRFSKGWLVMFRRGATLLGTRLTCTLIDQGDYITLGLMTSAHILGVYFFAFRLAAQPLRVLGTNFHDVLFPALTTMNEAPIRQLDATLKSAELLGVLIIPICFIQAAIAEPSLTLLFGTRWSESIPLIQILSLGLALDAISWPIGALMASRGQFQRSFKYQILSLPFFYALVFIGTLLASAMGTAIAVSIFFIVRPILYSIFALHKDGIRIERILASYFKPIFLGTITIGSAFALSMLPIIQSLLFLRIGVVIIAGGFTYLIAVRHILPDIYKMAKKQVLEFIER